MTSKPLVTREAYLGFRHGLNYDPGLAVSYADTALHVAQTALGDAYMDTVRAADTACDVALLGLQLDDIRLAGKGIDRAIVAHAASKEDGSHTGANHRRSLLVGAKISLVTALVDRDPIADAVSSYKAILGEVWEDAIAACKHARKEQDYEAVKDAIGEISHVALLARSCERAASVRIVWLPTSSILDDSCRAYLRSRQDFGYKRRMSSDVEVIEVGENVVPGAFIQLKRRPNNGLSYSPTVHLLELATVLGDVESLCEFENPHASGQYSARFGEIIDQQEQKTLSVRDEERPPSYYVEHFPHIGFRF